MNGKIICINKSIHKVLLENNTIIETRTRGKLRNNKIFPVVGDNVEVNINTKTITGQLVYKFADLFIVQWESMKELYPNSTYGGWIY